MPAKGWAKDEAGEWHPPPVPEVDVPKERRYKRPVYIHGMPQPTREGRRW